jgi:hypothetical protein
MASDFDGGLRKPRRAHPADRAYTFFAPFARLTDRLDMTSDFGAGLSCINSPPLVSAMQTVLARI